MQGSLAPVTMEYFGITATQQGLIVAMQSLGYLAIVPFLALKGENYNKIHSVVFGLIILIFVITAIGFMPTYIMLLALMAVLGVGLAFVDIMIHGVVPDVYDE